jgi:hypothetical protein
LGNKHLAISDSAENVSEGAWFGKIEDLSTYASRLVVGDSAVVFRRSKTSGKYARLGDRSLDLSVEVGTDANRIDADRVWSEFLVQSHHSLAGDGDRGGDPLCVYHDSFALWDLCGYNQMGFMDTWIDSHAYRAGSRERPGYALIGSGTCNLLLCQPWGSARQRLRRENLIDLTNYMPSKTADSVVSVSARSMTHTQVCPTERFVSNQS